MTAEGLIQWFFQSFVKFGVFGLLSLHVSVQEDNLAQAHQNHTYFLQSWDDTVVVHQGLRKLSQVDVFLYHLKPLPQLIKKLMVLLYHSEDCMQ